MKNALLALAVLGWAVLSGCGDTATGPSSPSDLSILQGSWTGTLGTQTTQWTYTFSGRSATVSVGGVIFATGTFSLNEAASPKTIDMLITSYPADTIYEGKTSLGIYQISGLTLIMANAEPGNTVRPTSFSDTSAAVFTLTKQ